MRFLDSKKEENICIFSLGVVRSKKFVKGLDDKQEKNQQCNSHCIMDKSKMAAWVNPRWHLSSSLDRCVGLICARILVVYWDVKGFKGINNQYDICQRESDTVMSSQRFSEFTVLYDNYLDYLHGSNGKLSSFWMSYIYMVEILLNFLRESREGDWELHQTAIRKMIPWCFAYENLNYAR